MRFMDGKRSLEEGSFKPEHIVTNGLKFAGKLLDQDVIQDAHDGEVRAPEKRAPEYTPRLLRADERVPTPKSSSKEDRCGRTRRAGRGVVSDFHHRPE
jgi:hypothetical protein